MIICNIIYKIEKEYLKMSDLSFKRNFMYKMLFYEITRTNAPFYKRKLSGLNLNYIINVF